MVTSMTMPSKSPARTGACGFALLASSWYGMMVTHELGHVLAAWATGARVTGVVLHPLAISQTIVAENPHPILVTLAGPVVGVVLPLLLWLGCRAAAWKLAFLLRFFAGFCLTANGAYLVSAFIMPAGDTQDLMRAGVPVWAFAIPGCAVFGVGLAIWNGMGAVFKARAAERGVLIAAWSALAILVVAMMVLTALQHSRT